LAAAKRQFLRPKLKVMMAETYLFSFRVAMALRPPSPRFYNVLMAEYASFT
jgi:hypothetical protein